MIDAINFLPKLWEAVTGAINWLMDCFGMLSTLSDLANSMISTFKNMFSSGAHEVESGISQQSTPAAAFKPMEAEATSPNAMPTESMNHDHDTDRVLDDASSNDGKGYWFDKMVSFTSWFQPRA